MNIEGFGESIVEDFYNIGYLRRIPDFYTLYQHKEALQELEGFGEKSINNLLTSIENSKNNSLEQLLFALGIRHIGKKVAKIIASKYKDIDSIIASSFEDISSIPTIGDIIAKSIRDYFDSAENIEMINTLKELGVNMKYLGEEVISDENFDGKTFVLTGSLESLTRNEASSLIELRGGKVTNSVTKKTDIVVVGKDPGSKYDKAKELGIAIWSEEELQKKLNM